MQVLYVSDEDYECTPIFFWKRQLAFILSALFYSALANDVKGRGYTSFPLFLLFLSPPPFF
jgi:hypothetical protein